MGCVFLPRDKKERRRCQQILEDKIFGTGQRLIGWRDVTRERERARAGRARKRARDPASVHRLDLRRRGDLRAQAVRDPQMGRAHRARDELGRQRFVLHSEPVVAGPSSTKACCLAEQLADFYVELKDPSMVSALAMVHQRFSTNTFPTWELAQPFRMLAHNGEINTVRGNAAWMAAREQLFQGEVFGEDVRHILPTITPGGSDSAMLDNVVELPASRRAQLAARDDDARARGLAKRRLDAGAQARVLRVPFVLGRAVGRSRRAGVHGWQAHRWHARPQRSPARALHRHEGRARGPRVRDGRARVPGREHRAQGPARARAHVSRSTPSSVASSRTKRSRMPFARASRTGNGYVKTRSRWPRSTSHRLPRPIANMRPSCSVRRPSVTPKKI